MVRSIAILSGYELDDSLSRTDWAPWYLPLPCWCAHSRRKGRQAGFRR